MDPKWSPDGEYISFIRNNNIYLTHYVTHIELKLTS